MYTCSVCHVEIPDDRVEFLFTSSVRLADLTCIIHAPTKKKQGLVVDDAIVIVDKVYNDDIRSVFKSCELEHENLNEDQE